MAVLRAEVRSTRAGVVRRLARLEDGELAGLAEDPAERVGDLAEAAEALDAVEDQRHGVGVGARAGLEPLQELFGLG